VLFEQWADPVAAHMAAFTRPDHMNRDALAACYLRGHGGIIVELAERIG
jgi:hypothetical protein